MTVLEALRFGRANAQRKIDLARRVGCSTREVEHEVERLRKSGEAAIASDSQVGYWRPMSAEEYAENLARRRSRAISQLVTVRGERQALRELQGSAEPAQTALPWAGA